MNEPKNKKALLSLGSSDRHVICVEVSRTGTARPRWNFQSGVDFFLQVEQNQKVFFNLV